MAKRTKRRNKNRYSKKRVTRKKKQVTGKRKHTNKYRYTGRKIRKNKMRGGMEDQNFPVIFPINRDEIDTRIKSILDGEKMPEWIEDKLKGVNYEYLFSIRFSDVLKKFLSSKGLGSGFILKLKKGLINTLKYPYSLDTITFIPNKDSFRGIIINNDLEVIKNDSSNELIVIREGSKITTVTSGIIDDPNKPVVLTNLRELFMALSEAAVEKSPITLQILEPPPPPPPASAWPSPASRNPLLDAAFSDAGGPDP